MSCIYCGGEVHPKRIEILQKKGALITCIPCAEAKVPRVTGFQVLRTKTTMLEPIMDMDSDISLAFDAIKDEQARHGLKLIVGKLNKFLSTHGIEAVQTDKYDTEKHEVVSVMNEGASDIHAVISKGYSLGDKIIRFPKVILK